MDGNSTVRVGVLGYGNVGAAVVALIAENGDTIAARTGLRLEVAQVAVRDLSKARTGFSMFTDDAAGVVVDPEVDLIVEVIGGLQPAKDLVLAALKAGKPVVTANKELMAAYGAELFDAAAKAGVDLLFGLLSPAPSP
jgi:homoserine dehydrogenase